MTQIIEESTNLGLAKKTRSQSQDKDAIDIISEFVDLGLPSGNLWCKHNVGATHEEETGDFLSFNDANSLEFDIEGEQIPSIEDCRELFERCMWQPDKVNGVKGIRMISRINNSDSIFFPFTGDKGDKSAGGKTKLQRTNSSMLWSSTPAEFSDLGGNLMKVTEKGLDPGAWSSKLLLIQARTIIKKRVNESNLGLAKKTRGKYEDPDLDKTLGKVSGIMIKKISLLSMFLRLIDRCDKLGIKIESTLKSSSGLRPGQIQVGPLRNNTQIIPWIKFCIAKKTEERSPNLMWANKTIATKYCCLEIYSANDYTGYSVGIVFTTDKDYINSDKTGTSKSSRFSRGPVMHDSVLNNPDSVLGAVKNANVMFLPNWVYVPTESGLEDLVNLISELVEVSKAAEAKYEKTRMTETSIFSLIEKKLPPERTVQYGVDTHGFHHQGFYHYKFKDAIFEERKYNGIDLDVKLDESRTNLGLAKKSREAYQQDNRDVDQITEDMAKMSFEDFYEEAKKEAEEFKKTCADSPWETKKPFKVITSLEEYRPDDRMQNNLFLNLYPWGCIEMCTQHNPFEELRDKFRMVFEPVGEPLQAAIGEYREECMTSEHFNGGIDGIRESEIEGLSSDRRVWYPFNIENLVRAFKWLSMKVEEYVNKLSLEESNLGLAKKTRDDASDRDADVEDIAVLDWDRFFKLVSDKLEKLGFSFYSVNDSGSDWFVEFESYVHGKPIDRVCIIMRLDERGEPKRFSPRAHKFNDEFGSSGWVAMRHPNESEFTVEMTPRNIDKMCKWIESKCPYETSEIFEVNESRTNLGLSKKVSSEHSQDVGDKVEEIGHMSFMDFLYACYDRVKELDSELGGENKTYEMRMYPSGDNGEDDPDPENRKYGKDHNWIALGLYVPNNPKIRSIRLTVIINSEYPFQEHLKERFHANVGWTIHEDTNTYCNMTDHFKIYNDKNGVEDKNNSDAVYYPFSYHYLDELVKWFKSEARRFGIVSCKR